MPELPLVKVPHPVGTIAPDALGQVAESSVDAIERNLLRPSSDSSTGRESLRVSEGSTAPRLSVSDDTAELFHFFYERGWTDGLPVLPPTTGAVQGMIAGACQPAENIIGIIPPLNGVATVEKIAANAVMAGCLSEYFPVVLTAVRGLVQPGFNLDGVQTTTGNVAPLTIVNGPCRARLNINCGANVLGQGWRANATIGRALRLIMTNIGGARPGTLDKSTMGQPAKLTFCIGENEAESPWMPLHAERGLAANSDAVSLTGCSGVYSAVDMASQSSAGLLKTFALTMIGALASGVTSTEVLWAICPEHAALLARDGFTKTNLRERLFELARVPLDLIADENIELLSKRRPSWFDIGTPHEIAVVDRPEDVWIVVAGGAGAKSAYLPGRTGTKLQTVMVEAGRSK